MINGVDIIFIFLIIKRWRLCRREGMCVCVYVTGEHVSRHSCRWDPPVAWETQQYIARDSLLVISAMNVQVCRTVLNSTNTSGMPYTSLAYIHTARKISLLPLHNNYVISAPTVK